MKELEKENQHLRRAVANRTVADLIRKCRTHSCMTSPYAARMQHNPHGVLP
jgi:hypothetical protein